MTGAQALVMGVSPVPCVARGRGRTGERRGQRLTDCPSRTSTHQERQLECHTNVEDGGNSLDLLELTSYSTTADTDSNIRSVFRELSWVE